MKLLKKKYLFIIILFYILCFILFIILYYFYYISPKLVSSCVFSFNCDFNIFFSQKIKSLQVNRSFIIDIIEDFQLYLSLSPKMQIEGLLAGIVIPLSFHFLFIDLGLLDVILGILFF